MLSRVAIAGSVVILTGLISPSSCLALDAKTFPGKGSKEIWKKSGIAFDSGLASGKAGNHNEAVKSFQQAISTYPHSDVYYRNLAFAYESRKAKDDLSKAEAAARKAVELDQKDWRNWNVLADVVGDQKRYRECLDLLRKAVECNPPPKDLSTIRNEISNLNDYLLTQR